MRLSEREFDQLGWGKAKRLRTATETEIQASVRDWLRYHGWFVIRHQQGLGCHRGLSDLTAIRGGRTVYIEVKKRSGKLSAAQETFQAAIESHGGMYIVARCIEDVQVLCN